MGIKSLPIISEQLIKAGRKASTPAALIFKGTNPEQKVYRGTLEKLNDLVELHKIKPPTLVVIGDVINTFDEKNLVNVGYLSPK